MKVVPFVAETAAAALAQIHEELGPDAVVLSVRPLPRHGLARLWQKSQSVEVLACVADQSIPSIPGQLSRPENQNRFSWSGAPMRQIPMLHDGSGRPHVFIGPPGTGKSTLLCKWLTVSVLNENRSAKVYRLDGINANTAEFLNIYGEMLGVAVERFYSREPGVSAQSVSQPDLVLIDLPGVPIEDRDALRSLKTQLAELPNPRVHLVLNAAYETCLLAEQFHAFSSFEPEDLSFCHLDEEKRQGKLLDFLVGTNCCLRFLSTGQKVPGDFVLAQEPSSLLTEFRG